MELGFLIPVDNRDSVVVDMDAHTLGQLRFGVLELRVVGEHSAPVTRHGWPGDEPC
jgi:hypothetical protein